MIHILYKQHPCLDSRKSGTEPGIHRIADPESATGSSMRQQSFISTTPNAVDQREGEGTIVPQPQRLQTCRRSEGLIRAHPLASLVLNGSRWSAVIKTSIAARHSPSAATPVLASAHTRTQSSVPKDLTKLLPFPNFRTFASTRS